MSVEASIVSERLVLEQLRVEHANEMIDVLADDVLYEFTGGEPPTLDTLRARYALQTAGSGRADEVWRNWIIRADGQAIGFVQADITADVTELAWVLGVAHQGSGFAAEAAIATRDQLTIEGSVCFQAFIHPAHTASQAVARRVGMARSGIVDGDGEEQWLTVVAKEL